MKLHWSNKLTEYLNGLEKIWAKVKHSHTPDNVICVPASSLELLRNYYIY